MQGNGITPFAPVPGRPASTESSSYLDFASPSSSNQVRRSKTAVGTTVQEKKIAVPGRPLNTQPNYGNDNYCHELSDSYMESPFPSFQRRLAGSLDISKTQHSKPPPPGMPERYSSDSSSESSSSHLNDSAGEVKEQSYPKLPGRPSDMYDSEIQLNDNSESSDSDSESASSASEKQNYKPPPPGTPRDLNPIPPSPRSRSTSPQRSSPAMSSQYTYTCDDIIEQSADGFQLRVDDYLSGYLPEHLDSIDVIESNSKYKAGWLQKLQKSNNNKVDFTVTKYWCSINEGCFSAALEKNKIPTDNLPTSGILTVKKLNNIQHNNTNLCCFNIVDAIPNRDQSRVHTFGASNEKERNDWISSIWRCLTPSEDVASSLITAVDNAGRFEYKKTVAGTWQTAWLGLSDRNLHLWLDNREKYVDLRKVKSLTHLTEDSAINISYRGKSIYLRSPGSSSETKDTFDMITGARNTIGIGSEIEDQFLTKRDVPVIVDLCLNHIFLYGLKTRDIYAKNVNHSKVETLMEALQKYPYNVNLSAHEYTVHDVASSLKMFFSKCAEPLLTNEFAKGWKVAYDAREKDDKLTRLQPIICSLKSTYFQTLRLLLLHLRSVSKCQEHNSMSEYKLAEVFGPILIGESSEFYRGVDIADVGKDIFLCMLENFEELFKVSEAELEHEAFHLREVLGKDIVMEKVPLPDNGVIVTVAIDQRNLREIPFKVQREMTAKDVCEQLMVKLDRPVRIDKVILCEMICNNKLARPIHFSELVLKVILRWRMLGEEGSGTNCLLFKNDDIYKKMLPYVPASDSILFQGEVRLAKPKPKSSFKKVYLKFEKNRGHDVMGSCGQLTYFHLKKYKARNSWNFNDLMWYIGSERIINPTRFAFTLIERNVTVRRTKNSPYLGTTVYLESEDELHKWMAVMVAAEYPGGILP